MKKIIITIIMAILFGQQSEAQVDTLMMAKKELSNMMSHLNKNDISSGILFDKTIHPISIEDFDGINDRVADFSKRGYLHGKLNEMYLDSGRVTSFDSLNKWASSLDLQGVNPVVFYDYRYNYIKDNAITSHLLDTLNGYLEDVAGRNSSPYDEGRIFMATPYFYSMGNNNTVSFYFGQEFFLTNTPSDMSKIQIDFGDGQGYRDITFGTTLTITFPNNGVFDGDIKIYDHASEMKLNCPIIIKIGQPINNLPFNPHYADIKASIPFNGQYAEGLYVYTMGKGNNSGCYRKPLIFVDGVDFGTSDRPHGATDRPCIDGKCGGLGYIDIATGWVDGIINAKQTELDDEGPRRLEFQLGPTMIEKLHSEGYDIIFLDFKDGATYMQANAMVLVELINYINAHKCSKEELVVLGASMGGQVTRYALSYMETKNMKHCVRSSIYFDSPHKGANISISMQLFMQYFANHNTDNLFENAKFTYEHKLTRPATFQLLNNSSEGITQSNGAIYGPHQYRIDFMNDLVNNLGSYPKYIRKVAVSNGSGIGKKNGIGNKDILADMKVPYTTKWLEKGWSGQDNWLKNVGVGLWRTLLYIPAVIYNGGAIKAEMKATSNSGSGNYRIFMGDANEWNNKVETDWDNSLNLGYDNAPGGMTDALKALNITTIISKHLKLNSPETYFSKTCFIPTNSGLGMTTNDLFASAKGEISNSNHPNKDKYVFDAYYAPSQQGEDNSQLHVQMTYSNINWLISELRRSSNQLSQLPTSVSYMDQDDISYTQTCNSYNFGTDFRHILNDIQVNKNGALQVNINDWVNYKISGDYWNKSSEQNFVGNYFNLYTSDCGSEVEINSGGSFIIGDNNTPTNNKGTVYIREGSNLYLHSGSSLYLYWGSKLIIEKGATLFVDPGANIYLEDNASIEIKGQLNLSNNAVFKHNGSGKVIFNNTDGNFTIGAASGSSIEFTSTKNETKLEVSGAVTFPNTLGMFKVDGAIVVANTGAKFDIYSPVYFDNGIFKPSSNNTNNNWVGLKFYNQIDNQIHIDQSKFYYANTALDFSVDYALNTPSFYRNEFYNNNLAMYIHDAGFTLNNCIFKENVKGIKANWITLSSTIQGCRFKDNTLGIDYHGNINALLLLKNNNIIASDIDIVASSSYPFIVTMGCNKFTNTNIDIDYANLNLSSTTLHNTSDYGGYNIFKESPFGLYNINYLNLKDGYNDFIMTGNVYINGSISNSNNMSSSQCNYNYFDRINGGAYALPNGITYNYYYGKLNISYLNANTQVSSNFKLYGTLATQQNGGCQSTGGGLAPSIAENFKTETLTTSKLYPNPTDELLNIEMPPSEGTTKITVIDMQGKTVFNEQLAAGTQLHTLPVKELPAGVYMMMLEREGTVEKLRFVRQ